MRYDQPRRAWARYLSGISAADLDFSRDGEWVTYTLVPEGTLWRSRVDGSERLQLTIPPLRTSMPRWSPDSRFIVAMTAIVPPDSSEIPATKLMLFDLSRQKWQEWFQPRQLPTRRFREAGSISISQIPRLVFIVCAWAITRSNAWPRSMCPEK